MKRSNGDTQSVRVVNNAEYIGALKELILEGKEVSLIVAGSSMVPFLVHQRDMVILAPVREPLKRGTVVLYQRADGSYILHRIVKVNKKDTYDITGDAQTLIERGVTREQIFAQVIAVNRKDVWLKSGDFRWDFFEYFWCRIIRMRPFILKSVNVIKRKKS